MKRVGIVKDVNKNVGKATLHIKQFIKIESARPRYGSRMEAAALPASQYPVLSRYSSFATPIQPSTVPQTILSPNQTNVSETTTLTPSHAGYVGERSVMPTSPPPISVEQQRPEGSFSDRVNEEFLKVTGAASLPPHVMVVAFADAYFKYVFHRAPVVDPADLQVEHPSVLLLQALCFVGTVLRHPKGSSPLAAAEQLYVKVKTLLYANHEKDSLTTLKAVCLIALWNVTPPVVVTFDCAWHWAGVAIRMAFQIGLHRESTYLKMPNPGSARRVAWCLYVSLPPMP